MSDMQYAEYFFGAALFTVGFCGSLASWTALTDWREIIVWFPVSLAIFVFGILLMKDAVSDEQ